MTVVATTPNFSRIFSGGIFFAVYVIDYGRLGAACTKEGREDAFKADAASVYVSVTQSNIA